MFQGDTPNESLILGGSSNGLDNGVTEYSGVMTAKENYAFTENNYRQVVPTGGTITNFYVKLNVDPGTAPDAYRFTVRLNGATVGQSPIVTITAPATTGNDLAHNLVVVAGDILTMMIEPLNGPSVEPIAHWGLTFIATIDGESIVIGGVPDSTNRTVTEYNLISGATNFQWLAAASEFQRYSLGQVCTLKKLHILMNVAPGAGTDYTLTLRIGAADSNVVATVANAAVTGDSGALEDTVALDDYVDIEIDPTNNPAGSQAFWGFVAYREVGWTGKISGVTDPAEIQGVANANIAEVKGVA